MCSYKGLPFPAYTSNVAVDPHNAEHVVVSFCNYEIKSIFTTWDGGTTWTNISGNLEENPDGSGSGPAVYWVEMLHENNSVTYFAGTTTGLYSTTQLDGLNTVWAQEGAETIGNVNVKMIVTREVDGEVVIATYGTGIYSRDFTTNIEENHRSHSPGKFELQQNYPNPFNHSTVINYTLHQPTRLILKIYDSTGREIRTLVNEYQQKGEKSIIWDGLDNSGNPVSSGIYIYRIQAGNFKQSRKMTFLK